MTQKPSRPLKWVSEPCLISLEVAAKLLDYSSSGLRKVVNRTKAGGQGPTIQFFQVGNGPIKFKPEWIEEFVNANTVTPKPMDRSQPQRSTVKRREPIEPKHGFDPALFRKGA